MKLTLAEAFTQQFTRYRAGNIYAALAFIMKHHPHLLEKDYPALQELVVIAEMQGNPTTVEGLRAAIEEAKKNKPKPLGTKSPKTSAQLILLGKKGIEVPPEIQARAQAAQSLDLSSEPKSQTGRAVVQASAEINSLPELKPGGEFRLNHPDVLKLIKRYLKPGDRCEIIFSKGYGDEKRETVIFNEVKDFCFCFTDKSGKSSRLPIPHGITIKLLEQNADEISLRDPDAGKILQSRL